MSADLLEELAAKVAELDKAPVSTHPEVLDRLHRALVGELESLTTRGTAGAGDAASPERPS